MFGLRHIAPLAVVGAMMLGSSVASAYPLPYAGRLTEADGKPLAGPVNLEIAVFATADATSPIFPAIVKNGVPLAAGVFSVVLEIDDGDANDAFADPAHPPWIQVKIVNGKTYPRQRFGVVPFALRVPNQVEKSYVDSHLGGFPLAHSASSTDNYVVKWDADADSFYLDQDKEGVAGGGINTINGVNGANQTFAIGTAGAAPAWSDDGVSAHTLDLPDASAAGVTRGLLSKAKFDEFDAKVAPSDPRLTDPRAPTTHAASHKNGGADEIATATPGNNEVPKAGGTGKLAVGWLPDATTAAKGVVQLAPDGGTTAATAVQATDSRLTNSRSPTAHAISHQNGGADEIATATAGANAIPKAGVGGKLANGWIDFAAPAAIGGATPAAGSFTTLSAANTLGVGTASPTTKVQIVGTTDGGARLNVKGTDADSNVGLSLTNDARTWLFQTQGASADKLFIWDETANQVRMSFDSSGNVGVGTNVATQKLEVNGSVRLTAGSGGGIVFADGTTQTSASSSGGNASIGRQQAGGWGSGSCPAGYSVTSCWAYTGAGNAVSGVSVSGQTCTASGGASFYVQMECLQITGTQTGGFALNGSDTFYNSGNVGVGTNVPAAKLDVWGEVKLGTGSTACAAGAAGMVRYNASSRQVEACVSFDGGSSWTWAQTAQASPILTSNRNYYVRPDGSDANTGLANTSGGAFLTIQKAVDTALALNTGPYDVFINVADSTTYASFSVARALAGSGFLHIVGNTAAPQNVVVTGNNAHAVTIFGGKILLSGFEVRSITAGSGIIVYAGEVYINSGMRFGSLSGSGMHMYAANQSMIGIQANYTIAGGAGHHLYAEDGGIIRLNNGLTVSSTGAHAFLTFAIAARSGLIVAFGLTFSGTGGITGIRYNASSLGNIFVNGGGANYFPGNSAGLTGGGGQYN